MRLVSVAIIVEGQKLKTFLLLLLVRTTQRLIRVDSTQHSNSIVYQIMREKFDLLTVEKFS